jgi:translation initiation factor 2 subunit 3
MLGHVDHGKTTLTSVLTGKWTDTHSEEIKRGISIRLGYADVSIHQCKKCKKYIAANEPCPQPQTMEHLIILESMGVKNIVIVQTKVDLVSKEKAIENQKQIKKFVKGTVAENAPIVPVAANYNLNISSLLEQIEKKIPTPKRDPDSPLRMYISRSFDVNKPGADISKLKGGVLGGSIVQGILKKDETIEVKPGVIKKEGAKPVPLICKAMALREENDKLENAHPGGLVAVGTSIDPGLTKSDTLVGSVVGEPGKIPDPTDTLNVKYQLLKRTDIEIQPLREGEPVVVNIHTATGVGIISKLAKGIATIRLKKPVVSEKGMRIALSKRVGQRWRLASWGEAV